MGLLPVDIGRRGEHVKGAVLPQQVGGFGADPIFPGIRSKLGVTASSIAAVDLLGIDLNKKILVSASCCRNALTWAGGDVPSIMCAMAVEQMRLGRRMLCQCAVGYRCWGITTIVSLVYAPLHTCIKEALAWRHQIDQCIFFETVEPYG